MNRPPALNLIPFGQESLVTNGELALDGSVRFPEEDAAEEVFVGNGAPPVNGEQTGYIHMRPYTTDPGEIN